MTGSTTPLGRLLNREQGVIKFNQRVLAMADDPAVPLLERLRYITIVSNNLDELFEILTWRMIRLHDKPVGLLDVGGYWTPLKELVQHQIREGFVRPAEIARLIVGESPHDVIDALNLPSA